MGALSQVLWSLHLFSMWFNVDSVGTQLGPRDLLPKEPPYGKIPMLAVITSAKSHVDDNTPDFIPG
jgi:hypothetical protein